MTVAITAHPGPEAQRRKARSGVEGGRRQPHPLPGDPEPGVEIATGDGRLDRIVQAMQLGAKGYVMKPFDGPQLVGEVRAMLA